MRKTIQLFKQNSNLYEIAKGSAISFILRIAGMLVGYLLLYVISHRLGAVGVGFFKYNYNILEILAVVFSLGTNSAVLRYVGQYNTDETKSNLHAIYRYYNSLIIPLTFLASILLFLFSDLIGKSLNMGKEYITGLKYISITLPFFCINQISVEFIRGLKKIQISESLRTLIPNTVIILGIMLLFRRKIEVPDLLFCVMCASILNSILSRITIWLELKKIPKSITQLKFKDFFFTSRSLLTNNIITICALFLPIFFLENYTNLKNVGIFTINLRLASLVCLLLVVLDSILAPKIAELFWGGQYEELQKVLNKTSKILFFYGLLSSVSLLLGAELILSFFGKEFIEGTLSLTFLIIGQFVNISTGSSKILLMMSNNHKALNQVNFINLLISAFTYYLFVPHGGLIAASIITMLSNVATNIAFTYLAKKKINLITFYNPFKFDKLKSSI
jgi:O-antigen/teichoic acid export membrane protein